MLKVIYARSFKTDYKKIKNNRQARNVFMTAVDILMKIGDLPEKYLPHNLSGEYKDYMECHLCPDLLLIYQVRNDELVLYLLRIGSHSALFKK